MFDIKKKKTYRRFEVLRFVRRLLVLLWAFSVLCAFETEFVFLFASIETVFSENGWLVAWALKSIGASSISSTYEETKIKGEHISDMNI
jgi:hypothetical protein